MPFSLDPRRMGWRELAVLVAVLTPAGLLYVFLQIVDEVREGETVRFDEAVLLALRNPADTSDPIGPRWLEIAMRDFTSLGSTTVLAFVTLAVTGYLIMAGKRGAALLVVLSAVGGTVLSNLFKAIFDRPRPDIVAHIVETSTASFPSGHAMLSAVIYLTLGALLARVEKSAALKTYFLGLAVFLTLAIGASRVYLGVHYPTDVLAGWSLGATWAMLCWGIAWQLQRRGKVEKEN
ncbi:MAG: phosphatase PAP2 family protein [Parvibaculaceae bacterium]